MEWAVVVSRRGMLKYNECSRIGRVEVLGWRLCFDDMWIKN